MSNPDPQRGLLTLGVLASAIFAATVNPAHANPTPDTEHIVVWGTQVKASSINLKEETIAVKQADHISDLLRVIPGVDVGGAHSLNQRITIRSVDDKDLRISIDGANQNTFMYHHMGNLQIHADILKSVDIDIGTNSVINGGLGGAVRFETKSAQDLLNPDRKFGGRIQLSYGDNSGTNISGAAYGQLTNTFDLIGYYNQVQRDNYDVGGGQIKDASGNEIANTDGTVRGLEGDISDALIKAGWDVATDHRVEIGYEAYLDEGDYSYRPDMGLATDLAIAVSLDSPLLWPTEFSRDTLTLNYEGQLENTSISAALFSNESSLERDETGWLSSTAVIRGTPASESAAIISGDADNQGFNALAETLINDHRLTYGFDYIAYETAYRADYVNGNIDLAGEESNATALFIQDRIDLNDSFTLIPGLRYDSVDVDSATVNNTFEDLTAALAAEYRPTDAVLTKLSATQLFKAPEIAEVFIGAGLFDTANPDIKAETGTNIELSLAYEANALGADRFSAGFTAFRTEIEDYIYEYAARGLRDNVGDMVIDGIEAYIGYDKGDFSALLTFSNAESELDASAAYASLDGARIDRQQGDTISLTVDYMIPEYKLHLHWDASVVDDVAAGADLDGPTLDNAKDGFTVHNISARWMPDKNSGLSVTLGVDNVFDEYYASQSSRTGASFHPLFGELFLLDYEPGRNVKATIAYVF